MKEGTKQKINLRSLEKACRGQNIPCSHIMRLDEAKEGVVENHREKKMTENNAPHLGIMHLKECK